MDLNKKLELLAEFKKAKEEAYRKETRGMLPGTCSHGTFYELGADFAIKWAMGKGFKSDKISSHAEFDRAADVTLNLILNKLST